jgi:hypothetical protein
MGPLQLELSERAAWRDARGAVFVEKLIAILPLLLTFFVTWDLAELCAAKLVVARATAAAGRAAVVVLPDDPAFYDDEPVHSYEGQRRADIELAAGMILSAHPKFTEAFELEVSDPPDELGGALEVTLAATYDCGGASLICGFDSQIELNGASSHAYQGAKYTYSTPAGAIGGSTGALSEAGFRTSSNGGGNNGGNTCRRVDPRTHSCGIANIREALRDRMNSLGVGDCNGFIEQIRNNTTRVREGVIQCVSEAEAERIMARDLYQRDRDQAGQCQCTPNDLGSYNNTAQHQITANRCRQFTTLDDKIYVIKGADGNCEPEESDILHETIHIMAGSGGKNPIQPASNSLNEAMTQVFTEAAQPSATPAYTDGPSGEWKACLQSMFGADKNAMCETYFGKDPDAFARAAVARARANGLPFTWQGKSDEWLIAEMKKYNLSTWQARVCPGTKPRPGGGPRPRPGGGPRPGGSKFPPFPPPPIPGS